MRKPLTKQQIVKLLPWMLLIGIMIFAFCSTSCSVQYESATLIPPNEDLLEYNENDFKVVSFDFPYAEVYLPDSTIDFVYCPYCEITGKGYLISDRD